MRVVLAIVVLVAAAASLLWAVRGGGSPDDRVRLAWVATAHQLGPVSYRDPAGAISPDGTRIAYSEGRFLRVRPIDGGPSIALPPGPVQIRNLSWSPDNRTILADGSATASGWALYDVASRTRRELALPDAPRGLAWSPDGAKVAGLVNGSEGQELRVMTADGRVVSSQRLSGRVAFPAWTPRGEIACVATADGRSRVTLPCGGAPIRAGVDGEVNGPIAFSREGRTLYMSVANGHGTVDLWSAPIGGGRAQRLTSFTRDTYAPTVADDGRVMFKVQSYRTVVSVAPAGGGPTLPLASFQSETPSWDPTGKWIGITYGTWRRLVDDAHYPDIAQEAGIIPADESHPAAQPAMVVQASPSEDQSLCWSPNGKWIVFHSHKDQSDDLWLRASTGDAAATRITFLGRGAETGWPRWSPDGRTVLFTGASRAARRTALYAIGVDGGSGSVTAQAREIAIGGILGDVMHAEWLPDSLHAIAIVKEGPGRHAIVTLPLDRGDARVVRRFASEHDMPGVAASPDGKEAAFIAPANDGFFQVFRMPLAGGDPVQVTSDPSNKTQPAWSPDGRRLAFTVWSYDAQFWIVR